MPLKICINDELYPKPVGHIPPEQGGDKIGPVEIDLYHEDAKDKPNAPSHTYSAHGVRLQ